MTDRGNCRRALQAAFEEVALALGGVVASYPIPDEAVWDLARALDLIHERAWGRCGGGSVAAADGEDDAAHPAIIHLLAQVRRSRGQERGAQGLDGGLR